MDDGLTLPPETVSVPAARRFVRARLIELGWPSDDPDAEMLVSELATNAVLHARTPFTITVTRNAGALRVCVLDGSSALPRTRDYGTDATTGRGMRLVAAMSDEWGADRLPGGKAVWFDLTVERTTDGAGASQDAAASQPPGVAGSRDADWTGDGLDTEALLARFSDDDVTGALTLASVR